MIIVIKYASILSRLLGYTFKLVGMKNTLLNSIKLELSSNHLLNKLTKHIKENNWLKDFVNTISRFTWLGYNNRNQLLEVFSLVS